MASSKQISQVFSALTSCSGAAVCCRRNLEPWERVKIWVERQYKVQVLFMCTNVGTILYQEEKHGKISFQIKFPALWAAGHGAGAPRFPASPAPAFKHFNKLS
jgi:hypothetical protein